MGTLVVAGMLYSGMLPARVLKTSDQQLPTPKALTPMVQFWEKIFSYYGSAQCVLHDSRHLDVVYFVADVPVHNKKRTQRIIKRATRKVERTLRRLASGRKPTHWFEKHVLKGIPRHRRSRDFFQRAQHRVRCQRGIKSQFSQSLQRSKSYLSMIKRKFRRFGIPQDLAYLPHLESGFRPRAKSKAGARGLWQIMPATARQYMRVNRRRDERLNPYRATTVAARILKNNYERTRSWPLAITGYNYGINGVVRAMRKLRTRDYMTVRNRHRSPIFKFAAKNFYPSFLAVRNLAKRYEHQGRPPKAQEALARRDQEGPSSTRRR
jgi:membrane-bound lytic murein transglycosylase D